jgi:hypothetical protein
MLISDRRKPVNVKIAPFRQADDARDGALRRHGTAAKLPAPDAPSSS